MSTSTATLMGKRVLVVEDDYLLATDICRALNDLGATVLGPAPTPFYALSLLGRRGVDTAVLDIRLHNSDVFEVADELLRRGVPMVFATAYGGGAIPARFRAIPQLDKPLDHSKLLDLIQVLAHTEREPVPTIIEFEPAAAPVTQDPMDDRLMRVVVNAVASHSATHGADDAAPRP